MEKSRDAFRTISEVADWLDVPTHVLRFWESRFSQIKPVKRAGGRRYYRPADMRVIGGVKTLLHDQGMTIRGVQKMFREQGIKHVSGFSPPLFGMVDDADDEVISVEARPAPASPATPAAPARSTHGAAPDPVLDDEIAAPAPLFSHRSAPTSEPEVHASVSSDDGHTDTDETPAEAASPEASAPPRGSIPPTPDVPDADPEDDDQSFAAAPSAALRLRLADPAVLARYRDDLAAAAGRLRAILDRAS
ncbi:MerR family transcriptional regulator [Silicimonas algicola]|uniref:MerR-like DNA binding protein n=1 Tax=Silicimonas algicola TaxID=1826607 RepID=A0A316G7N2_9RHOB|nr:MerR family transcriptional regulator [Silicimonas algicola]PWK56828.1 MerR-like DNA binding protein [Silicimonas algicola]